MATWRIPANLEELDNLTGRITQLLEENDCPQKNIIQTIVVAEEIFVNIAHYAYQDKSGEALVHCAVANEDGRSVIRLEFEDWGIPYNPLEKDDPDTTMTAEDRQIGGLGIFMSKKMMDEISYSRSDGRNKLVLVKYI